MSGKVIFNSDGCSIKNLCKDTASKSGIRNYYSTVGHYSIDAVHCEGERCILKTQTSVWNVVISGKQRLKVCEQMISWNRCALVSTLGGLTVEAFLSRWLVSNDSAFRNRETTAEEFLPWLFPLPEDPSSAILKWRSLNKLSLSWKLMKFCTF